MSITKLAQGKECQVRIPGVCNGNAETTVMAHYRLAGLCGVGIKPISVIGAWACSSCHDAIDGRAKSEMSHESIRLAHAEGVMRTLDKLIGMGYVKV